MVGVLTGRFRMAKASGGRPKRGEEEKPTKNVRMHADLVDMISDIVEVANIRGDKLTAAKLLDPLLRKHIIARHKEDEAAIRRMNAAREAIRDEG